MLITAGLRFVGQQRHCKSSSLVGCQGCFFFALGRQSCCCCCKKLPPAPRRRLHLKRRDALQDRSQIQVQHLSRAEIIQKIEWNNSSQQLNIVQGNSKYFETLFWLLQSTVGSQRLSRLSVSKNMASCSATNVCNCSTSFLTCSCCDSTSEWPGIGMLSSIPVASCKENYICVSPVLNHEKLTTPGKMATRDSAAAFALRAPAPRQCWCRNRDCRTGFE